MKRGTLSNLIFGTTIALMLVVVAYDAMSEDFRGSYGQDVTNPYSAPIKVEQPTDNDGIKVEDTESTIKVEKQTEPTGQLSTEEFDGLVTGRDGH